MGEIYGRLRDQTTLISKRIAGLAQRMRRQRKIQRVELFALHDFEPARGHSDQLPFTVGDVFLLKSDADMKWWLVKHLPTGRKGYVPMSFVARAGEREHLEWYDMRMTRDEAIRTLSSEKYEPGAFLIRPKEGRHFTTALALTVKMPADEQNETKTLHYVINREDGVFRIEGGRRFPSITQLVQYYAGHHSGMRQPLTFSVKQKRVIEIWEIDLSDLEVDEEHPIGDGFFGKVYTARMFGSRIVAVKSVKLSKMSKEDFMKEADIAREFSHRNIVKTLGICSPKPYIITEFLPGGNLKDYVKNNHLFAADYVPIALKIAAAMVHLESRGFVHRDLAARNILVGETKETIKLADFGLARRLDDSEYYTTSKLFPYKWTPPEGFVLDGNSVCEAKRGKFTTASDVWSFAVVLWEMFSKGAEPYPHFGSREIYDKLRNDNYRLTQPTHCPPVIYEKMLECWSLIPGERPTFAQLHTFLLDPYAATAASTPVVPE